MMKVCFLLVVATVAVLQASGEEKTPTTQDSSMARKDDLEERLLKKIEELGAKLHFEILNGDRDVKDLLEDKLQDDRISCKEKSRVSRVILPMSRVILPMSRVILPMSRVILLICRMPTRPYVPIKIMLEMETMDCQGI